MKLNVIVNFDKNESGYHLHSLELTENGLALHKCCKIGRDTFPLHDSNNLLEEKDCNNNNNNNRDSDYASDSDTDTVSEQSEVVEKILEDGTKIQIDKKLGIVEIWSKIFNFNHSISEMWPVPNENLLAKLKLSLYSTRLDKDFEVLDSLGSGAFGIVLRVKHKVDEHEYAVKKVKINPNKNKRDYKQEAKILAKLNHSNIIRYHTVWIQKDFIYIQMQLCSCTLEGYIDKYRNQISPDMISKIFREILDGVQYIHSKNIIHSDLKMDNIFLDNNQTVKIGDFGISDTIDNCLEDEEKWDIYYLGRILVDLLFQFETKNETCQTIDKIKEGTFKFPDSIDEILPCASEVIPRMLRSEEKERPSILEVYDSFFSQ